MTSATSHGTRSSPTPLFGVFALLAALVGLPLALAARADAEPAVGTAIGRANLDGTGLDHVFIDGGPGYEGDVDLDAEHVYWTRSEPVEGTSGSTTTASNAAIRSSQWP
jgi:hypothetical protein